MTQAADLEARERVVSAREAEAVAVQARAEELEVRGREGGTGTGGVARTEEELEVGRGQRGLR